MRYCCHMLYLEMICSSLASISMSLLTMVYLQACASVANPWLSSCSIPEKLLFPIDLDTEVLDAGTKLYLCLSCFTKNTTKRKVIKLKQLSTINHIIIFLLFSCLLLHDNDKEVDIRYPVIDPRIRIDEKRLSMKANLVRLDYSFLLKALSTILIYTILRQRISKSNQYLTAYE